MGIFLLSDNIFLKPNLNVFTVFSAAPLLEGWYEGLVKCWILFYRQNSLNSEDVKGVPLSETMVFGKPNLAKTFF